LDCGGHAAAVEIAVLNRSMIGHSSPAPTFDGGPGTAMDRPHVVLDASSWWL